MDFAVFSSANLKYDWCQKNCNLYHISAFIYKGNLVLALCTRSHDNIHAN